MINRLFRAFTIKVPKDKLVITFSKSSGPGGQHVNKTNSKVDARFNVDCAEWITPEARARLKSLFAHHINKDGELIVQSQSKNQLEYRDQFSNEADAIEKIEKMVNKASEPVKERDHHEYKESDETKKKRIELKRAKSERLANKKEKDNDYIAITE